MFVVAPWRNMRERNIGWRLDYVLASQALFERVQKCEVQKAVGTSDHAPVVAEFAPAPDLTLRQAQGHPEPVEG